MKIEIKERKLTEGKRTLYLEYYESGYRKRENLHLYLLPDLQRVDKKDILQKDVNYQKYNHRNNSIVFTFFSKKGFVQSCLKG